MPRLQRMGGKLLPNWLAITVGRDIYTWRDLSPVELRHELEHVRQWSRYKAAFPVVYLAASIAAQLGGRGWYRGNRFEEEARAAAGQD
jgi:hypothetical protein